MDATAALAQDLPAPFRDRASVLECPVSGEPLLAGPDEFRTASGSRRYSVSDGIANLFAPLGPEMAERDITAMVKAFYEETPFPNYDDLDTRDSLARKARQ